MFLFPKKGIKEQMFVVIPLKGFPSVCDLSLPFLLLFTHTVQSLAFIIQSPFQLIHLAQVWLRKRCVSLPCIPAQCVFSVLRSAGGVCVLSCTVILNDVMFSYCSASVLLDSAALLCYLQLFLCFLSVLLLYLCLSVQYLYRGAEFSGIPNLTFSLIVLQ